MERLEAVSWNGLFYPGMLVITKPPKPKKQSRNKALSSELGRIVEIDQLKPSQPKALVESAEGVQTVHELGRLKPYYATQAKQLTIPAVWKPLTYWNGYEIGQKVLVSIFGLLKYGHCTDSSIGWVAQVFPEDPNHLGIAVSIVSRVGLDEHGRSKFQNQAAIMKVAAGEVERLQDDQQVWYEKEIPWLGGYELPRPIPVVAMENMGT